MINRIKIISIKLKCKFGSSRFNIMTTGNAIKHNIFNWATSCCLIVAFLFMAMTAFAQVVAFPGAEGYGRYTTGGRGGSVIEVTNLNDNGPGSLRAAILASGPRTVIFRVSGTIKLLSKLTIKNGNITIAGQTAPGDGICIRDYPVRIEADNVIVRYLRFRLGDSTRLPEDSFSGNGNISRIYKNIIIDHCSISWAIDECSSFYDNGNFTMQWCFITESLYHSYHDKGNHGYGGMWGGWCTSFHHNLLAHHSSRNPRFNGSRYTSQPDSELVDFRNNVIYNWGFNSAYGGEAGNQNMVANYFKYGPATNSGVRNRILQPSDTLGNWHIIDNFVWGYPTVTSDNWNGGVQGSFAQIQKNRRRLTPFPFDSVTTHTAEQAFDLVLAQGGANFPKRDTIDARIVYEVRTGTATHSGYWGANKGIIDSQDTVGGWPLLYSLPPPLDSDRDGIPDNWEMANGLNPNDSTDGPIIRPDGYSNLEHYINSLVTQNPVYVDLTTRELKIFKLNSNYPNPFNPSTTIEYEIPYKSNVTLEVFNLLGKCVATLVDGTIDAGVHWLTFDATNLSSGVYFYRIRTNNFIETKRMLLIK